MTLAETETVTETFVYPASLRVAAEAKGLLIGSVAENITLNDPRFADILIREFNAVTPEGMTWPSIDCCGYGPADAVVRFASSHKMRVKGHPSNLAWKCTRLDQSEYFSQVRCEELFNDTSVERSLITEARSMPGTL